MIRGSGGRPSDGVGTRGRCTGLGEKHHSLEPEFTVSWRAIRVSSGGEPSNGVGTSGGSRFCGEASLAGALLRDVRGVMERFDRAAMLGEIGKQERQKAKPISSLFANISHPSCFPIAIPHVTTLS